MEARADREEKQGKYQEFNTIEELIAFLHHDPIISCPQCGIVFYPESAGDTHCNRN
jgi:phage pi2 protein 07